MTPSEKFLAELAELNRQYAADLPARLARVDVAWAAVRGGDRTALEELLREAHYLAGSGATFGQPAVSEAAGALEMYLWPLVKGAGGAIDEITLAALVSGLRRVLPAAPA